MSLKDQALRWSDQESYVDELMGRARIDCGTGNVAGVNEQAAYYQGLFEDLGFQVTLYPIKGYGNNLSAVLRGKGKTNVALLGHLDTVYLRPGLVQQYPPHIMGDRLYGLGTSDMHGGNLMMIEVLRFLLRVGFDQFGTILVVLNVDEERNSMRSRPWIQGLLKRYGIHVALEFEAQNTPPGEIQLTVARRSQSVYDLEILGEEGHAGLGEGHSAIWAMVSKLARLKGLIEQEPGMSVNPTNLEGANGTLYNVTAGRARVRLSLRATTLTQHLVTIPEIKRAVETNEGPLEEGVEAEFQVYECSSPPYNDRSVPRMAPLIATAQSVAEELDLPFNTEEKGGTSDGNTVAEIGIPVLASCGPIGGGEHKEGPEEHIFLGEPLSDKFVFVAMLLVRLCESWVI